MRHGNITHTGAPSLEEMRARLWRWEHKLREQGEYTHGYNSLSSYLPLGMLERKSQPQGMMWGGEAPNREFGG